MHILEIFSWLCQDGGMTNVNMLKVLYRDHVENTFALHKSSKTISDLNDLLIGSGHLTPTGLALLYDAIKATQQFGLEREIKDKLPSFQISKNICDNVITTFTLHRRRLVRLGMARTPHDVEKISGLCDAEEHTDSWIMDLEHRMVICEGKMDAFIEKLKMHELHQAVKALTEDILDTSSNSGQGHGEGVKLPVILKRKRDSSSASEDQPYRRYAPDLLIDLAEYKDNLNLKDMEQLSEIFDELATYYRNIGLSLCRIGKGSIVNSCICSLSQYSTLMNLCEIHLSRELMKDLAVIVLEEHQQEFLDEWMAHIDEIQYKAARSKLKEKVQNDLYDVCIVSDDTEWENQLMEDLKQRRPDLNCTIMKKWRLSKHETIIINNLQSGKVIIGFSPKPLTEYCKYAAHSVVVEMLKAKTLDVAQLIPVKISEDAVGTTRI